MESMGETWCNYPPWPPRNDVIRMKVAGKPFHLRSKCRQYFARLSTFAARKEKLRKLRPRTKNEICNSELPCALQTNYGAKFDPTCPDADTLTCNTYCEMRGYGKILPTSCGPEQPQGLQEGEFELFGLTEAPESYRANSQNHSKKGTICRLVMLSGPAVSGQLSENRVFFSCRIEPLAYFSNF